MSYQIQINRVGDQTKPHPFTILIINNSCLKPSPQDTNNLIKYDPITQNPQSFFDAVDLINKSLFCQSSPNKEDFMRDINILPFVRVISIFYSPSQPTPESILVESIPFYLIPLQNGIMTLLTMLSQRDRPAKVQSFDFTPDIVFVISNAQPSSRYSSFNRYYSTAVPTIDDQNRGGTQFIINNQTNHHYYFCQMPGCVALSLPSNSVEIIHEFSHALASMQNKVIDLYKDYHPLVNLSVVNKRIRNGNIPPIFATYTDRLMNQHTLSSDLLYGGIPNRNNWLTYHCERFTNDVPALMDNYTVANEPHLCKHDKITRQFLIDRILSKIMR